MRMLGGIAVLAVGIALLVAAEAGHESPVYPSYYPQEIRLEPVDPASAGRALEEGRIQAYVGTASQLPAEPEKSVGTVESLGSYLVIRPSSDLASTADHARRCELAGKVASALGRVEGFRLHPYPVNPYHADYLHHFDLAVAATARFVKPQAADTDGLRLRAVGGMAERLVKPHLVPATTEWDASVEEVSLDDLVAGHRFALDGWMGPPWLKEGWFHAYLLLAPALAEAEAERRAAADVARLQRGEYRDLEERINLERRLVRLLTAGCRALVAGYGLRRWPYSADYSNGIENIGYDSHTGLRSAIFVRTVKLKDFPWNGWLTLGVPTAPSAAWNPLAGFTDETGRFIWLTLGDPALFPEPYNAQWSLNRIGDVQRAAR